MEAYEFFSQHQRGEQSDCTAAKVKGTVPRDQAWFSRYFHILGSTRFRVTGDRLLILSAFISLKLTELMTFIFKSKFSCTSRPANCDFYYFVHCWGAVNIVFFLHSFRQNLREKQNTTTHGSLFMKHAVFPNVLHWTFTRIIILKITILRS